jgi:hypothetical protein
MRLGAIATTGALLVSAITFALAPACGSTSSSPFSSDGGPGSSGSSSGGGAPSLGPGTGGEGGTGTTGDGGCVGLQCQQTACTGGGTTTISGHVYDPAGTNPLYKVVVYVPDSDPSPITDGINSGSCSCDSLYSGNPIAAGITDATGKFTVTNAPAGANIPIVVQIGKWRNYFTIPNVASCTDNDADTLLSTKLTLPKTQTETKFSNIPNIAVSTGSADTLECILARIGVAESEYTGDPTSTTGHIHIFQGAGGNNTASPKGPSSPGAGGLWDTDADINRYDVVMLSCEGSETTSPNSQVLADYVNGGGRVFASHYHYAFFFDDTTNTNATQFPNVADWTLAYNAATGAGTGSDSYSETIGATIQTKLASGSAFPEGQALATFLANVGALGGGGAPTGELAIPDGAGRYDGVVGPTNVSTVWAASDPATTNGEPASSQYFSFDMPFNAPKDDAGVPEYCGRVVFSDLHVGAASNDYSSGKKSTVPTGCSYPQKLAPDEDAIEFILFDLSSCVTPVSSVPQPPPVTGPPPK